MVDHPILIWIWHSRIFTLSSAVFFIAGLGTAHIKGCWLPTQPSGAERQIPMCKNNVLCECCCSLSLELQTSQEQKYILGDRAYGIQIPSDSGDSAQQRVRPDWSIVLAYEFKLTKEAMKKVLAGHTLAESLEAVIRDPDLKEAYFTTPTALHASMPESQPNKFVRHN